MSEQIKTTPFDQVVDKPLHQVPDIPSHRQSPPSEITKTPEEVTRMRMQRLEEIASSRDFDIAQLPTALNVQKFLETEDTKPMKHWLKFFTTIDDWKLYFRLNPDWQDLSINEIQKKEGVKNFYKGYYCWIIKQTNHIPQSEQKLKRRELTKKLFTLRKQDWSEFDTLEKWQEYSIKQGWDKLSVSKVTKTKEGMCFYTAYRAWVNKYVKSLPIEEQEIKKRELRDKLFVSKKQQDWSNFDTFEKWQQYLKEQGIQNLFYSEIKNNKEWFNRYRACLTWVENQIKNLISDEQEIKRRELVKQLFPLRTKNKDWSNFDTLEIWQQYLKEQGIQNLSYSEIKKNKEWYNLYRACQYWVNKYVKNLPIEEQESKRKELFRKIFPSKRERKNVDSPSPTEPKIENQPSQNSSNEINWDTGFTTKIVDIVPIIDSKKNNDQNPNRLSNNDKLTPAQILRLFAGRENQVPEFYAKHIDELATYVIHRGAIDFLAKYFQRTKQQFPQLIADFGSGPSTAYSAYQELWPIIAKKSSKKTPPIIHDFDKSQEMLNLGNNSDDNKHLIDFTKEITPFENSVIDMVQSTFVIHHFKPKEILQTLVEANRITKNGGHLLLFSIYPFSQPFISGVEQLGYQVITQQGEILVPNEETLNQITSRSDLDTAKKFQNQFDHSFILFAQKILNIHNPPSLESFVFNQQQIKTKRIALKDDFTDNGINPETLTKNIDQLIGLINYEIQNLIYQTNEIGLWKSGDEIKGGYYSFSDRLNQFEARYNLIQNFREKGKYIFKPEEIQKLIILREKIVTARKTKINYRNNHYVF